MRVAFHTNLDLPKRYVSELTDRWGADPPPIVGDQVVFNVVDSTEPREFRLEVVSRRWLRAKRGDWLPDGRIANGPENICRVELHIPRVPAMSIADWEKYYRRHVEGREW